MSLQGYATQEQADSEIICAYSAPEKAIASVAVAPGWVTVGTFFLTKTINRVRFEMICSVSDLGIVASARIIDPKTLEVLTGSTFVLVGDLLIARSLSPIFPMQGQQLYAFQAQGVGPAGTLFVNTAGLVGP